MTKRPLDMALAELHAAHQIIRNALNLMTTEQKIAWAGHNEASGCAGEGTTRANEREMVIQHLQAEVRHD